MKTSYALLTRCMLLAALGAVAPGALHAQTAEAVKPIPPMQPAPSMVPGRPDVPNAEVEKQLRNTPPLPFPLAEEKLPLGDLKVPKGFKVEVYTSGIANARSLRMGDKGTLFVSNRLLDKVWAVVDRNGKRENKVIASGLDRPNGLAFHKGTLYIA